MFHGHRPTRGQTILRPRFKSIQKISCSRDVCVVMFKQREFFNITEMVRQPGIEPGSRPISVMLEACALTLILMVMASEHQLSVARDAEGGAVLSGRGWRVLGSVFFSLATLFWWFRVVLLFVRPVCPCGSPFCLFCSVLLCSSSPCGRRSSLPHMEGGSLYVTYYQGCIMSFVFVTRCHEECNPMY